jgi:hypothetical protein
MSKRRVSKLADAKSDDRGFLSRWSARKTQIARGTPVSEDKFDEDSQVDATGGAEESDEEKALSDAELLEKYELPNPEGINEESGLDQFFDGQTPERLKQLALRRLWRINPFFGVVDEMVEYGEDYTDAATVIDGMQTAYQAGKGYLQKALSPEEAAEKEANQQDSLVDGEEKSNLKKDDKPLLDKDDDNGQEIGNEKKKENGSHERNEMFEEGGDVSGDGSVDPQKEAHSDKKEQPAVSLDVLQVTPVGSSYDEMSHAQSKVSNENNEEPTVTTGSKPPAPRAKRMIFRSKTNN